MLDAQVFAERRWARCDARRRATFPTEAQDRGCLATSADAAVGTGPAAAAAELLRAGLGLAAVGTVSAARAVAAMAISCWRVKETVGRAKAVQRKARAVTFNAGSSSL